MTIVLKHLAREFQAQPRRIRMILRQNDFTPHNGRWSWKDDDPQLDQVRELLRSTLNKDK